VVNQISFPAGALTEVDIARERTFGGSIELCAKVGGYSYDKELSGPLNLDKGQLSRWQSGQEGILWDKLVRVMDYCGNHAPVYWMLYQLGYDITSLRKRETELEKRNRELMEENKELRKKFAHFEEFARIK
jgi:hypothetical protein